MVSMRSPVKVLVTATAVAAVSFMTVMPATAAARIVIVNNNAPGVGFNDPTPAVPVGGNPGVTKGEQRLIAFQHAADRWGAMIDSPVEIRVRAQFVPLGAGVLGSAGATFVFANFPGAAFADTWYHSALADKLAGFDLGGDPDLQANFSTNFDFYLGLDNNHGSQVDLVAVVLHELGHGLGFANFVNEGTGANFSGRTDIYSQFTYDTTLGTTWATLTTNADRAASARRTDKIVWNGPTVTAAVPHVLTYGRPGISVNTPAAIAGLARVGTASFGPALSSPGVAGQVVVALDEANASGPSPTDACTPITNAAAVSGRIALVDRGACAFTIKVKHAQDAGAMAVLVADSVLGDPPAGMGGADATITITAVRITQHLGAAIKAQLGAGESVAVSVGIDESQLAGADPGGLAQLFATNPVQAGSSISHYDSIAFRNQLMEPAINGDLTHELIAPFDMTLALMRDIGWFVDGNLDGVPDQTFTIGRCTTRQPDVMLSNGASLVDQARSWYSQCTVGATSHGAFVGCVAATTNAAVEAGLITGAQKGVVQQCAAQSKR